MPPPQTGSSLQSVGNAIPTQAALPPGVFPQKQEPSGPHSRSAEPAGGHWNGSLHDATQAPFSQRRPFGQQRPAQKSRFLRLQRLRLESFAASVPSRSGHVASAPPASPASTMRRVSRSNRVWSKAGTPCVDQRSPGSLNRPGRVAYSGSRVLRHRSRKSRRSIRLDTSRRGRMARNPRKARIPR
jgi:hypothetical protein